MSSKVEEEYQNVLNTHTRIMAMLQRESLDLKTLPQRQPITERIPLYETFEALSFDQSDFTPLVHSVICTPFIYPLYRSSLFILIAAASHSIDTSK
jgi:hypothetical protein